METIKVNMTPCEDVQTIHASQNDSEAREWGFELHNNGDVIDSSEITDQIVFKAYEGGTEELLPSSLMNGSVDLGSLAWTYMPNNYFRSTSVISDAKIPSNENTVANILCSILKSNTANNVYANNEGVAIDGTGRIRIYYDDMPTDVASFTQAMQGVLLWYEKSDSTPTTTPFLGDIKYPQGLLTNQQFTYRESPTEEDGLANIVDIKGQTLKWNQTVQVSNIVATKTVNGVTFTNNSDGTVTMSGTANNLVVTPIATGVTLEQNHVYYLGKGSTWSFMNGYGADGYGLIKHNRANATIIYAYIQNGNSVNSTVSVQCIDFTKLFGETKANEIFAMGTDDGIAYFKSLFPLDYYPFNNGSLIPFNGNGLKTVGKNQINLGDSKSATANGITASYDASTQKVTLSGTNTKTDSAYILINFTPSAIPRFKVGETYVISTTSELPLNTYFNLVYRDTNNALQGLSLTQIETRQAWRFTIPSNYSTFNSFQIGVLKEATDVNGMFGIQIEKGSSVTSYEPYTESVINLPISTYFPSGMKSIEPNQYTTVKITDELIPTKATTRVGSVTIDGNTPMNPNGATSVISAFIMPINGKANGRYNIMSDLFEVADGTLYAMLGRDGNSNVQFSLPPSVPQTSADGKAWFAEHPTTLYFELATYEETEITTASLVTENAEIPLSNNDGVLVGKCTEQLSSESGFFDAKIKLSDSDGDVYSNKIQLHVERSPQ